MAAEIAGEETRAAFSRAYDARPVSTSLFSAHFGLNAPPSQFGLDHYGEKVLPDWATSLREFPNSARLFAHDPSGRMPICGVANYAAVDESLAQGGPALVTVVGPDYLANWTELDPSQEKDRRERWLDAFQSALDHRAIPAFPAR